MEKRTLPLVILILFFITVSAQNDTKHVALLWDSSYGMSKKNAIKEFAFMDSYFNQNPNIKLDLVVFCNTIILKQTYEIINGNWDELKNELEKTTYDGSTTFTEAFNTSADEIILVSDGDETIDKLPGNYFKPVYVVCSMQGDNESRLRDFALKTGGDYIPVYNAQKGLKTDLESNLIQVSGVVTDNLGPLSAVHVFCRSNGEKTITGNDGRYTIVALRGSILEFNYLGKETYMTRTPNSGIKNIVLIDVNGQLDEVVLIGRKEKEGLVDIGDRRVDKRKVGYAVESIGSEEISALDTDLQQAVKGQFSGLSIQNDTAQDDVDLSQFLGRNRNMTLLGNQYGLVVIDGLPIRSSPGVKGRTDHIDPTNVSSITYLKGLAATNRYGSEGAGGVLVIKTKNNTFEKPDIKSTSSKKKRIGTTPYYTGSVDALENLPNTTYINALKKSDDIVEAYEIYLQQRKVYGNEPSFFFNVATYFNDWNNPHLLDRILSNVLELKPLNSKVLMALAYKYDEFGLYNSAVKVYEKVLEQEPNKIQNYRNLALSYHLAGNHQKTLTIYDQVDKKQFSKVANYRGLEKTIDNEFKNFIGLRKKKLSVDHVNSKYFNNIYLNTRIVFEWNVFDAEFDIQIVNPQKRYFTWSHTEQENPNRFEQEKIEGFGMEEFFITENDLGEWLFNLTYYGNRYSNSSQPAYLKATIYRNFGKINQTQKTKVIMMDELNRKETIFSVKI